MCESSSQKSKLWPGSRPLCLIGYCPVRFCTTRQCRPSEAANPPIATPALEYTVRPGNVQLVQLRDFASGVRASAPMSPIAKARLPDEIADVTAYFAAVNAPFLPLKTGDAALVKRGDRLLERRRFFGISDGIISLFSAMVCSYTLSSRRAGPVHPGHCSPNCICFPRRT